MPVFEVNSYTPPADTPSHVQCMLKQVLLEVTLQRSLRSSGLGMKGDAELGGQAAPGIVPSDEGAALAPGGDVGADGADAGFANLPMRRSARECHIAKSQRLELLGKMWPLDLKEGATRDLPKASSSCLSLFQCNTHFYKWKR